MTEYFDVAIKFDAASRAWEATLVDTAKNGAVIGKIDGDFMSINGHRVFFIGQSDLDENYQGKGVGVVMYTKIIRRILDMFPSAEFRSSTNRNEYSGGVWKALLREFSNVTRRSDHYAVSRTKSYL